MEKVSENFSKYKSEFTVLFIFLFYTSLIFVLLKLLPIKEYILMINEYHYNLWYIGFVFMILYIVRGFFYFPSFYFLVTLSLVTPILYAFAFYMVSLMISGVISYRVGLALRKRNFLPRIKKIIKDEKRNKKIKEHGLKAVFISHVTGVSLDIPNYISGYLKLSFKNFLLTIFAANFITTVLYFIILYPNIMWFLDKI